MTDRQARPLTRAELLGGLSGRRVSTSLYAIESHTARLALEARHATAPAICEDMIATKERAFLSALAAGRRADVAPTIQQLERLSPLWAHLVPPDALTRADLAHRLADKHRFRRRDVPGLARALGLDDPAVRQAFERRHGRALETVYADSLPPRERLRWNRARLAAAVEDLPPFWSAFSLTLTQTVGAGVLALPIALAGIGPLPGLVLLAVLGMVNVATAAAVAEAFARTGTVRWGGAYFGRVVTQYLGGFAGVVLSLMLTALAVVVLIAYYVGLATTLMASTGVPATVWVVAVFAVTLLFVWRERLDATVVTALLVGGVNILIVVALSLLALPDLTTANLTYAAVPFVDGRPFDPRIVDLVFGVVLLAFFGHTAVGNGARFVLRRDPSGRALVRGTTAAMVTALGLYAMWSVAVGSAVDAQRLATESGTALVPMAEVVGPVVLALGSVFVVLAMGMAAVQFSIGLHFQATEVLATDSAVARVGAYVPLIAVFALVQWLLLSGRESFTGALSLVGTLTAPVLAGVLPVLLLAATRRRGDYVPEVVAAGMGSPLVRGVTYAIFLAAVVAHGAVIWQAPAARVAALGTAAVLVAVTWWTAHAGSFVPCATVEVRRDRELGRVRVRLTDTGRPGRTTAQTEAGGDTRRLDVDGELDLPEGTASVTIDLAGLEARELQVWSHEVDATGSSAEQVVDAVLCGADGDVALDHAQGRATATLDADGAPTPVLRVRVASSSRRRAGEGGPAR